MGSKMVTDRQKSSTTVQSGGAQFEDKMALSMGEIFGPEAEPATRTLVKLAVGKLKNDTDVMVQADNAHLKEVADDSLIFEARDKKSEGVYSVMVDLRETGGVVYGPDFVRQLGFEGSTPTDPVAVKSLAEMVLQNLNSIQPPEPRRRGLKMDLSEWKSPLANGLGELGPAVQAVSEDKREGEQTLVAKQASIEKYDDSFSVTANILSTLLKAAGEEEPAKRVRPSTRKPGHTIEDAKE